MRAVCYDCIRCTGNTSSEYLYISNNCHTVYKNRGFHYSELYTCQNVYNIECSVPLHVFMVQTLTLQPATSDRKCPTQFIYSFGGGSVISRFDQRSHSATAKTPTRAEAAVTHNPKLRKVSARSSSDRTPGYIPKYWYTMCPLPRSRL